MTPYAIRLAFGDWLAHHFGWNVFSDGISRELFQETEDEFTLYIDPHECLVYTVDGRFYRARHQQQEDRMPWVERRELLEAKAGADRMKTAAETHGIDLEWTNSALVLTCRKMWCLNRQFRIVRAIEDDETTFQVEGLNEYKPFPDNPMLSDDQIHCFILHKMLLKH